jgi:hypothetical protein
VLELCLLVCWLQKRLLLPFQNQLLTPRANNSTHEDSKLKEGTDLSSLFTNG